ncbi:DUF7822 domain-containing protein [Silvimonas amylolytica]|uniref:DUF7822 domain-containing protein n=1 Tax=Silvimonas amylolytica TaxID=449663 RepID=UPI00166D82F5|nr:hypothetical protein [Silvimonas amylolytica]
MANRAYLYSLDNCPTSYADRPDTITGLSEWAYDVPFIYRVLMSGDPKLCASLISDGFMDEDPSHKTALHAISSTFDSGFQRVNRLIGIMRILATMPPSPPPALSAPQTSGLMAWVRNALGQNKQGRAAEPVTEAPGILNFLSLLDETSSFLAAHRNTHLLLETIELDCMSTEDEAELRELVTQEVARCLQAGVAVDALPSDPTAAALLLQQASRQKMDAPLDAFFGLRFDDHCDSTRNGATEHPVGLAWSDVLYFTLQNRTAFETLQHQE